MSSQVAVITAAQRNAAFNAMPKPTQEIARRFQEIIVKVGSQVIKAHYAIGKEVERVMEKEAVYGAKAVEDLAIYWGVDGGASLLRNLRTFATSFTEKFVEEWMSKPMGNGKLLTLGHWFHLMKVREKADLDKLLPRVLDASMSVQDLAYEIDSGGSGATKHTRRGGRKPRVPSSPLAGLQKTIEVTQKLSNFSVVAIKSIFDGIDELAPDKISSELLKKLENARDMTEKARESSNEMLKHLDRNIQRVEKVLAKKPGDSAANNGQTKVKKKKKKTALVPA